MQEGPGFSWGGVQAFNPSTREARQEDLRVGLVYKASSRTARAITQKNPVLKKKGGEGHEPPHTHTPVRTVRTDQQRQGLEKDVLLADIKGCWPSSVQITVLPFHIRYKGQRVGR